MFINNQLDALFFFLYLFIPILYMFRATKCSSSEESIVSINFMNKRDYLEDLVSDLDNIKVNLKEIG